MTTDDDARDLAIHNAIEAFTTKLAKANGFTRIEALDRMLAFIENDDEGETLVARPAPFIVSATRAA